jgi:hypothetical protein
MAEESSATNPETEEEPKKETPDGPAEEEPKKETPDGPAEEEPKKKKNSSKRKKIKPLFGRIRIPNIRVIVGAILRVLLLLLIIGGLGVFSYIGYVQISSGNADVYSDKAFYNFDEFVDSEGFLSGIKMQWNKLLNPATLNTHRSVVETNENNVDLGVDIIKFESTRGSDYFEGDTIRGIAIVKAASLSNENSLINLNCDLENYYGEILVTPKDISYFGSGRPTQTSVGCSFIEIDKISLPKLKNSLEMKFTATFEGYAIANYDVYLMERNEFERISYGLNEDPFNYYGISDSHLRPGNVMVSTTTPGPVNLAIGSSSSQPFVGSQGIGSEGEKYHFQISLTSQDRGNIKQVKKLILKVPSEIVLDEDRRICDFQFTGEYDGSYKIYSLTDHAFYNVVNRDCSADKLESAGITEHNCLKDFDTMGVILECFFEVPEYSSEWSPLVVTNFIAEVEYIYEKEKKDFIVIRRSDNSESGSPCANLNEGECKSVKGCIPNDLDEFDECISCSANYCSDYDETSCNDDYCQLDCNWISDVCEVNV